jgi:hypothetical protein
MMRLLLQRIERDGFPLKSVAVSSPTAVIEGLKQIGYLAE